MKFYAIVSVSAAKRVKLSCGEPSVLSSKSHFFKKSATKTGKALGAEGNQSDSSSVVNDQSNKSSVTDPKSMSDMGDTGKLTTDFKFNFKIQDKKENTNENCLDKTSVSTPEKTDVLVSSVSTNFMAFEKSDNLFRFNFSAV